MCLGFVRLTPAKISGPANNKTSRHPERSPERAPMLGESKDEVEGCYRLAYREKRGPDLRHVGTTWSYFERRRRVLEARDSLRLRSSRFHRDSLRSD